MSLTRRLCQQLLPIKSAVQGPTSPWKECWYRTGVETRWAFTHFPRLPIAILFGEHVKFCRWFSGCSYPVTTELRVVSTLRLTFVGLLTKSDTQCLPSCFEYVVLLLNSCEQHWARARVFCPTTLLQQTSAKAMFALVAARAQLLLFAATPGRETTLWSKRSKEAFNPLVSNWL